MDIYSQRKSVALYGGSFDPFHLGHLHVINETLKKAGFIDEIWLLPSKSHQWKKLSASPQDRLQMLKFFNHPRVKINKIDLERPDPIYTSDTVRLLKQQYPNYKFYWLCGSDILTTFKDWQHAENLTSEIEFLVFPRSGYPMIDFPPGFRALDHFAPDPKTISSTEVRARIKNSLPIDGLVLPEVATYIKTHQLYLG